MLVTISGSGRVQPSPFRLPVATVRWALPVAGHPPPEPLPVSVQCVLLWELLWIEKSLRRTGNFCSSWAPQEITLAFSSSPVPGAVPASQAGGNARTAEGWGGLLYPASTDQGPEALQGSRSSLPLHQLILAGLGLLPAAALCLRGHQDP